MKHPKLVNGPWFLKDLKSGKLGAPKLNKKVLSCFCCGGGSTMGYKLAGYDVLGGVEIDPEMQNIYVKNHNPKYMFKMGVGDFNKLPREKIPDELFDLDILDGSPPCSSFSMAGSREKKWGVEKKFREGQAKQVLDDLFFTFIETAKLLQPKVVVAENVKGLIQGNARGYVKEIFKGLKDAGYDNVQLFLLNSSKMGVPQRRERTFFVANRLGKKLKLDFDEKEISVLEAFSSIEKINYKGKDYSKSSMVKYWEQCLPGESFSKYHPKGSLFGQTKLPKHKPVGTLTSKDYQYWSNETPRGLSKHECFILQSYPQDYLVKNDAEAKYICGMSVPPFMTQRLSLEIYKQILHGK